MRNISSTIALPCGHAYCAGRPRAETISHQHRILQSQQPAVSAGAGALATSRTQGLNVTSENFAKGGSSTLQALVAGSTDIAVGFYDHTIQMQAQDKHIVAFVLQARQFRPRAGRAERDDVRSCETRDDQGHEGGHHVPRFLFGFLPALLLEPARHARQ